MFGGWNMFGGWKKVQKLTMGRKLFYLVLKSKPNVLLYPDICHYFG